MRLALLGGAAFSGAVFSGSILLSPLHWDHVQGLPFCPVVDHPTATVDLYLPAADRGVSPADLLARGHVAAALPDRPGWAGRQVAISPIADRLRRHRGVRRDTPLTTSKIRGHSGGHGDGPVG